jgi:hypothetical protein
MPPGAAHAAPLSTLAEPCGNPPDGAGERGAAPSSSTNDCRYGADSALRSLSLNRPAAASASPVSRALSATSKADPRRQQDRFLKCLQCGRAHPLAACGVATLCSSPPTRAGNRLLTLLLTLQNPHTHTNTYARTLTNQHGSHWQHRRNDATELAHADMTALPKTDTNYTAL